MRSFSWLATALSVVSAATINRPRQAAVCNNAAGLCEKPYNRVVHLGAHDSPFVRDGLTANSVAGNQYYNSTVQLSAGVRLLSGQVHRSNTQWHLCHSSCDLLDAGPLELWLLDLKLWLDANPQDVVTILLVNSDNATPAQLHDEFTAAGLLDYVYRPPGPTTPPTAWPTLQALIADGTRLVTFVASFKDAANIPANQSYLMDEFTFVFENNYNVVQATEFDCDPDRPVGLTTSAAVASRMALMNHFMYKNSDKGLIDVEEPAVERIRDTNSPNTTTRGTLGQSADNCTAVYGGIPPTFLLVDFVDQGPAMDTVDRLNGVLGATSGRAPFPPHQSKASLSAITWQGVLQLNREVAEGRNPPVAAWIWAAGKWSWGGMNMNGGGIIT